MKKIMMLMICLCLAGCGLQDKDKKNNGNSYCDDGVSNACKIEESADMSAYENFKAKDNQFVRSDMKTVLSMIEKKESGVVYFGFPACPWCVEALPIMNDAAKDKKLNIMYVQTRDENKELMYTAEQKKSIMAYTDAYLEKDEDGEKQFYVPFLIVVKDGKVVAGHIGTVDGYDTHERKMNDAEKAELKDIYLQMFEKL